MKDKNIGLFLIALTSLIILLGFDFIIIPLVLQTILGWFGVGFNFAQCLVITVFFNIITYNFRKKG